jgi:hypothetical protein
MPDFGDTWGVLQYAESFQPFNGSEDSPEPAPKPSASSRAWFCWVMGKGGVKHGFFLDVRTHMHRLNGTNVFACFSSGKT